MIEHFELATLDPKSCLLEAELSRDGQKILNTGCDLNGSKFIRLSDEYFPDLEGPQLEALSEVCLATQCSEEFFSINNATNQWLRTVIGHEDLHPETWIKTERSKLVSDIIIHSNILPYYPYWSKLRATRDGAKMRIHFPLHMLKEAVEERKTLKMKLCEWKGTEKECEIGKHGAEDGNCEQPRVSNLFREIQADDVKFVRVLAKGSDGIISLITWRGGKFVRKELKLEFQTNFDLELEVAKRFSHPHIVYSFGKLCDGIQSSFFMEYMANDLFNFIVDRVHRIVDDNKPPFSPHDSVDVLLQIAKAMRHMHQENVNVVHCDLKSLNILISEIATSDDLKHYLVKVADFGSARLGNSGSGSTGFIPGNTTTNYAPSEVLKQRDDKMLRISFPHKIDVYSFGIVAYEVLTGKNNAVLYKRSPSRFKKGVIDGVRPPLRGECQKHKDFIQDKELISLIERCWLDDPSERPCFVQICEELDKVNVRISEQMLQSDHPPRQINTIWQVFKYFQGASVHTTQIASASINATQ